MNHCFRAHDISDLADRIAREVAPIVTCPGVCVLMLDPACKITDPPALSGPIALAGTFPLPSSRAIEALLDSESFRNARDLGAVVLDESCEIWRTLALDRIEADGPGKKAVVAVCRHRIVGLVLVADSRLDSGRAMQTLDILLAVASQASVAIDNAYLLDDMAQGHVRQRELLWQLIEAQEEERKRIAGEIHDRMGRRFFEFYYGVRQCQEILGDRDPETGEALARLVDQARDCAGEIRDLINELRPSVLDDFGFIEALKEHIAHLQTEGEFEVSLRLDEAIPQALAPEANVALFRAFQEAVMNARKHSSARQLWIEFTEQPEGLFRLLIRDDGCGFDPEKSHKGHYGLLYMKERIEACGGELRVHSAPGAGTEIQAVVPRKRD